MALDAKDTVLSASFYCRYSFAGGDCCHGATAQESAAERNNLLLLSALAILRSRLLRPARRQQGCSRVRNVKHWDHKMGIKVTSIISSGSEFTRAKFVCDQQVVEDFSILFASG
jgi:hypothetical protein